MIKPYTAVALQVGFPVVRNRDDIKKISIPHVKRAMEVALPNAEVELPVRLVALPEAILEGWTAEYKYEHKRFCDEVAITIPGEETELLGELAKRYKVYIMANAKSIEPDIIRDRFFNCAFVLNPEGKVILKHFKVQDPVWNNAIHPQDVWDAYVAKYGDGIEAFFQVADTEIGRMGCAICTEGSFPDIFRALGLQGAEIVYRPSYLEPYISGPGNDWWEIQNRARALDNNFYMVCPNSAQLYNDEPKRFDVCGGGSMIVDYRGRVLSKLPYNNEGAAVAKINIEELRDHRERGIWGNWISMLHTELYKKMYDRPIAPNNRFLRKPPGRNNFKYNEDTQRENIKRLQKEGIFLPPSVSSEDSGGGGRRTYVI
ncbi:MAG: nitrilase-related carbon-nitrogen hydrolase [Chloroflexota bacterium]